MNAVPSHPFPRGFLWGAATASHQVEGGNSGNQWWAWEQAGHTNGKSGAACDWWDGKRWREDFDNAAAAGHNIHRFSVEWSRIEPQDGKWDGEALERYLHMLRDLRDRNIMPMVTLHHFSDPLWLTEKGGWENEAVITHFTEFTRKVVNAFKDYCTLWCTINEPNTYALLGYLTGQFPPGVRDLRRAIQVQVHMALAHAAAYRTIHGIQPHARVGYAQHYRPMVARNKWSPLDRMMRNLRDTGLNLAFPSAVQTGVMRTPFGKQAVPVVRGTQDYFGLNYYTQETVWFDLSNRAELFTHSGYPKGAELSETGFIACIPEGLRDSIRWAARMYPHTPILITENGTESHDDAYRRRYIALHLHQTALAIEEGLPVKGYIHWSLVDNFEWERGWTQRFGLWELDTATQKRTARPSAEMFAEICRANALTSDTVQRHCPEIADRIFPAEPHPTAR